MAVNTATALAKQRPDSTLLIDLNVACGDAAVFLGAEPRFSVMDALENVQPPRRGIFQRTRRSQQGRPGPARRARPARDAGSSSRAGSVRCSTSRARRINTPCWTCPRSDSAALDSLELATQDRAGRQSGAGDGSQRQPHGGDAASSGTVRRGSVWC